MRILLIAITLFLSSSTAREANSAYNQGDFERAVELYNQAIADDPENAKLYFNLGNALAKAGRLQDALVAYDAFKHRAQTDEEKSLADYSIGNTMGQMNDWGSAANFFRNALIQNPDDPDARHNYELALKKKEEQEKQQQQQKQDQDKDQNKDQKQDQQQQQNQDQKQDEKKEEQHQSKPDDQQKPQQDQKQQQQPKPEEIDKKQAEKILEALENKEEDLLKQLKKKKAPNKDNPKKDW